MIDRGKFFLTSSCLSMYINCSPFSPRLERFSNGSRTKRSRRSSASPLARDRRRRHEKANQLERASFQRRRRWRCLHLDGVLAAPTYCNRVNRLLDATRVLVRVPSLYRKIFTHTHTHTLSLFVKWLTRYTGPFPRTVFVRALTFRKRVRHTYTTYTRVSLNSWLFHERLFLWFEIK